MGGEREFLGVTHSSKINMESKSCMNYTFQELCKKEDYSSFQGENYYFDYLAFGTIGKSRLLEYVVQVLPSVSV